MKSYRKASNTVEKRHCLYLVYQKCKWWNVTRTRRNQTATSNILQSTSIEWNQPHQCRLWSCTCRRPNFRHHGAQANRSSKSYERWQSSWTIWTYMRYHQSIRRHGYSNTAANLPRYLEELFNANWVELEHDITVVQGQRRSLELLIISGYTFAGALPENRREDHREKVNIMPHDW